MKVTKESNTKNKIPRNNNGITLIALVITIIVMLILVGVTISMAVNGELFEYAGKAVGDTQNALNAEGQLANGGIAIGGKWYNSIEEYLETKGNGTPESTFTENATVSGSYIVATDVNEATHALKVSLTSDTVTDFSGVTVTRYGSNLLDMSSFNEDDEKTRATLTNNGDGTYTITRMASTYGRYTKWSAISIPANTPFVIGADIIDRNCTEDSLFVEFTFSDGTKSESPLVFTTLNQFSYKAFQFDKKIVKMRLSVRGTNFTNEGETMTFGSPRLIIGTEDTGYQPYVALQTATADASGTVIGITSTAPVMTLLVDNSEVSIVCEYQKKKITNTSNYTYNLEGKTIVNFGDSIFGNYKAPSDISTFISQYSGATVYNGSFGGCRMTATHTNENFDAFSMHGLADAIANNNWTKQDSAATTFAEEGGGPRYVTAPLSTLKSIDFSKVDIITIAYGTNDFTGEVSLDDYESALRYSINTIKTALPNIEIVLCTQVYRFWMDDNGTFTSDSNDKVINGQKLTDFVQRTKSVADEYELLCIDNYNGSGICKENRTVCFSETDGTHPNVTGRQMIAENMAKELYKYFEKM